MKYWKKKRKPTANQNHQLSQTKAHYRKLSLFCEKVTAKSFSDKITDMITSSLCSILYT
jgi:hypothetical protein